MSFLKWFFNMYFSSFHKSDFRPDPGPRASPGPWHEPQATWLLTVLVKNPLVLMNSSKFGEIEPNREETSSRAEIPKKKNVLDTRLWTFPFPIMDSTKDGRVLLYGPTL